MTEQSMVERVAAAIWQSPSFDDIAGHSAGGPRPSAWQDAHPLDQAPVRVLARAAIETMRASPTREMLDAGLVLADDGTIGVGELTAGFVWGRMITAALSEPKG